MWKNIEKDTTEIVYDNKNLHITELEDTRQVYSMYKMATAGVPCGTILAVHLQKCSHLANEIRVMQTFCASQKPL
jgi:hypothetical protein